ncbi:Sec-independent protein translocase, TatC subunit [Planctopirus limnophila DSM 3776]|uniref:Sec-independent protein translocase protein TatC n=1 Tax=Planctopirus limnophila (strain ATCC 43296 / DSM 3776 / IFAM 1008 / Mu 290) TaxID=521674 RepID=D5SQP1_PLAL2|nr:twin-arginine translocase subunit TatC [Planctopirus limnophila]ADG68503.1 Sec-independent protein translocase, TatC subunit [Planctopirus limnophila DSM 3776]
MASPQITPSPAVSKSRSTPSIKTKDLFDDSTMTFGEHLEVLRVHVFRAMIGLVIAVCFSLYAGEYIVAFIRQPIDAALVRNNMMEFVQAEPQMSSGDFFSYLSNSFWALWGYENKTPASTDTQELKQELEQLQTEKTSPSKSIDLQLSAYELLSQLHQVAPESLPAPKEELKGKSITVKVMSDTFSTLRKAAENSVRPIALNVQEAFMTYLKVGFVSGLVFASPWVIYQLWLFVAAGLYPHERRYVYIYLPFSIGLFLAGAAFCYFAVFPLMLDFLLGYNARLGINPQIRISEWISFAVSFPLMFGISFQLPLVMMFLAKINVVTPKMFREQRRMAILVIAIASMLLTPSGDPASMILMMAPLLVLYELGIYLCKVPESSEEATSPEAA